MDSLQDIMAEHRFEAPDETKALKGYLANRYSVSGRIKVDDTSVILMVPSSALAATLQLEREKIAQVCGIKKRLIIRVGR
ncbi:MAG TPA: hypothetical protein VG964_01590 [Candidatus Saccharimonadales bacterium]|nr:hypothetical protein [Candidatus Saccharimonadales bacterium]